MKLVSYVFLRQLTLPRYPDFFVVTFRTPFFQWKKGRYDLHTSPSSSPKENKKVTARRWGGGHNKTLSCGISITLSALVRERRALALNVIEMAWQERNLSQALRLSALGLCLLFWVATVRLKRQRPREIKPEIHYFSMKNRFHTLTLASWKRESLLAPEVRYFHSYCWRLYKIECLLSAS